MSRSRKTNGGGRSTTGEPALPYYVESPAREAAKYLRLTATRFLAERASSRDDKAHPDPGPKPGRTPFRSSVALTCADMR